MPANSHEGASRMREMLPVGTAERKANSRYAILRSVSASLHFELHNLSPA